MTHRYKQEFIQFALDLEVLRFGKFTLKSGRISPYFFNSGLFNSGASLARLGRFYATAILDAELEFDMLYGPAYKGIPLAAATSIALADQHQRDVPYAFNRKEAKDHGEGGSIVGAPLQGKVLIIDDVISAGTSVRESVELITQAGATPSAVSIALDRQERGTGAQSAVQEVAQQFSMPVANIIGLQDLIGYLRARGNPEQLQQILDYQHEYGVD
jgi:orotate phosphoribosyltransferase